MELTKMDNQKLVNRMVELETLHENVKKDIEDLIVLMENIESEYNKTMELLEKRLGVKKQ
jgi:hypothetical protein